MTVFLPFHNLYISPCLSLQSVSHVIYLLYQLISFDLTLMYKLLEDISCFWYYFHWSLTSIYISTWDVVNRKNLFEFTNSLFFFFCKIKRHRDGHPEKGIYTERSCICWFIPQTSAIAEIWPDQSQELDMQSMSSMWVAGA